VTADELQRAFWELKGRFDVLSENVEDLSRQVRSLNESLAHSKGTVTVLFWLPSVIGSLVAVFGTLGARIVFGAS
jgi:hypothetical protein